MATLKQVPPTPNNNPDNVWEKAKANSLPVEFAVVHQPVAIGPDAGSQTVDSNRHVGIQMWATPAFLHLEHKGFQEIIPISNVVKMRIKKK